MTQEPAPWIELLKAIPSVVTAVTAIVGVSIAARGLTKWRTETIGKRKAELAEEVLADFYEARYVINYVRSPGSFSHEGATRKTADWETENDTRTLNMYFVTIERVTSKAEFFARLHARRYRFMAHFGLEAGRSYDEFHSIYAAISVAASMLINTHQNRDQGSLPQNRIAWEATIGWAAPEDDKIPPRLDALIYAIEKICRQAIQEAAK